MFNPGKEFKRVAAVAVMLTAAFNITACHKHENSTPAPKDNKPEYGFCYYGCPTGAPSTDRIIARSLYVLSNNKDTKFADWVAYTVSKATIGPERHRVWHKDPDLSETETLRLRDYKDAFTDLHAEFGHQAPLSSLSASPDWKQADYLSNATPQNADLNDGAWKGLETAERALAEKYGHEVHSVTGTLYERKMPKLKHAHVPHKIPSGYWKMITVVENDRLLTAAFIMDQKTKVGTDFCTTAVVIGDVNHRAHITLLPQMPEAERKEVEKSPGNLLLELGCKQTPRPSF
jgi:endonuclease G